MKSKSKKNEKDTWTKTGDVHIGPSPAELEFARSRGPHQEGWAKEIFKRKEEADKWKVSIKALDEFMECVINKKPYIQQWPVEVDNPTVTKKVDANSIWDKIRNI